MTPWQRYYLDGYQQIDFDCKSLNAAVDKALDELPKQSEGFNYWLSKYPDTYDLRPCAPAYDERFVAALFENDVPERLVSLTQRSDLTLVHCQVRQALPRLDGYPSYMPWHRDTYLDKDGKWVGNTPSVHKLIVYLDPVDAREPRLHVLPRSHRMMFDQPDMDVNAMRNLGLMDATKHVRVVRASNTEALMFDTSLLHSVVNETNREGSVRVIYSFATFQQYLIGYAEQELHRTINRMYEERKRR